MTPMSPMTPMVPRERQERSNGNPSISPTKTRIEAQKHEDLVNYHCDFEGFLVDLYDSKLDAGKLRLMNDFDISLYISVDRIRNQHRKSDMTEKNPKPHRAFVRWDNHGTSMVGRPTIYDSRKVKSCG